MSDTSQHIKSIKSHSDMVNIKLFHTHTLYIKYKRD
jgi:hypothetical protein